MRLHHLAVTAFGPFADRVEVDFDELNDAGLFLLTGATGAGKSSLLDAVCFALYGTVPGARGVKTLKSQHAPVEVRPEVELDFSVQGRRFVVRRTPEWSRPKRRGEGMRTENASAAITETTDGTEHLLSSRAAEVGHLVGELMGMSATQFVQVALLPQGEFQTFLRASSQERHGVLQQLFRTDRFSRIEDWVQDHSRLLRDRSETGRADVQRLVEAVAERSDLPVPDELCGDRLPLAAAAGDVAAWVGQRVADGRAASDQARRRLADARREVAALRERAERLRTWRERRTRGAAARSVLADLERSAPDASAAAAALDADARAARCEAVLDLHRRAVREHEVARSRCEEAVAAVEVLAGHRVWSVLPDAAGLPAIAGAGSTETLAALVDDLQRAQARVEALLPRARAARAADEALDRDTTALLALEEAARAAEERAASLPDLLARLGEQVDRATAEAALAAGLSVELTAAHARAQAAERLVVTEALVAALEERRRDARDRAQDAREQVQDLVTRRLRGMAAELAGALAEGAPCVVCGSIEHPAPASVAEGAVTDDDQEAAEARLVEIRADREHVEELLEEQRGRRDADRALTAGLTLEEAAAEATRLATERSEAQAAAARLVQLRHAVDLLRGEQEELGRRGVSQAADRARLVTAIEGHRALLAEVAGQLTEALGAGALDSDGLTALDRLVRELRDARSAVSTAHAATVTASTLADRVAALDEQARATATDLGFSGLDDVSAARLADSERSRLEELLAQRATAGRRAEDALAEVAAEASDERTAELLGRPATGDLDPAGLDVGLAEAIAAAAADLTGAEQVETEASREAHLCDDRTAALERHVARLDDALLGWAPARDESLVAESMSRLVRGLGQDNQLQMRLSSYVLATRLDQVVAAANERLGQMRDQRYLLQRTARAEDRRSQAGLGLEVIDQWTGDVRSPRTLSGGETFVVSLSLALGLADVVTHEAGGTEIETLFVDEGFGTLDADTLDDVMDRLDGLRAGGRTVGVVSHVTELRARIPTQVQVEKGRAGSTVRVRTLVG